VILALTFWSQPQVGSKDQQETEQTPKGLTVPVPRREAFFANLKRVGKPEEAGSAPTVPPTEPRRR
jgi:hypothetical protein